MFDAINQPLSGLHSIEASAGTGKTHSITILWLRLLVEASLPVEQILVSTFTRAATAELKERLHATLQRALAEADKACCPASQAEEKPSEELKVLLKAIDIDPAKRSSLHTTLSKALSSFDLAPIFTIHSFCQTLIGRHALELGCDPQLHLIESNSNLLEELVSDTVMEFADRQTPDPSKLPSALRKIAETVAARDQATILVDPDSPSEALIRRIQKELPERKASAGVRTFDDILITVRDALRSQGNDGPLAKSVRKRLSAAIIDECQDSDTTQIEVFQSLFNHADTHSFIVIGDPKQSIYRFRGADLTSYKQLAKQACAAPEMTVNYRSDKPLINVVNALYGEGFEFPDGTLPESPTRYIPVSAKCEVSRITDPDLKSPFVIHKTSKSDRSNAKHALAAWVAEECKRLLHRGVQILDRHSETPRPLRPGDVAVLAATKSDLMLVRRELLAQNIPCQMDGKGLGTVFNSDEAWDVLIWLELHAALGESGDVLGKLCAFLATPLGAASIPEIDELRISPARIAALCTEYRKTSQILKRSGPLPALIHQMSGNRSTSDQYWERRITNWRHLGALLQSPFSKGLRSPSALVDWLKRMLASEGSMHEESGSGTSLMKLETDEPAVQLLTIHASKGLEFPIVFCPFLWHVPSRQSARTAMKVATLREPSGWILDAREGDPDNHRDRSLDQEREEDHRKLYVAITRARHRLYAGLAEIQETRGGHRNGSTQSSLWNLPQFAQLMGSAHGVSTPAGDHDETLISVTDIPIRSSAHPASALDDPAGSARASLMDRPEPFHLHGPIATKRSFSSLSRSGISETDLSHEPDRDHESIATNPLGLADRTTHPDLLEGLGKPGSELGDRLHRVLEDYLGNDVSIADACARFEGSERWENAIRSIVEAPLKIDAEPLTLESVRGLAITEMQFHLPTSHISPRALSEALLEDPLIANDAPRRAWAETLATWRFDAFSGFLQGFIDLIFEHQGRWYVADYKSNRLPSYGATEVETAMQQHHYLLQSRIYTVALHRHLMHHLDSYHPEKHFGGVIYLFVRGLPENGVWMESPQKSALDALSSLFPSANR